MELLYYMIYYYYIIAVHVFTIVTIIHQAGPAVTAADPAYCENNFTSHWHKLAVFSFTCKL